MAKTEKTDEKEPVEGEIASNDAADGVKLEVSAAKEAGTEIEGLEQLKKQLAEEKKARLAEAEARAEAERRANEQAKVAFEARNESEDTNLRLIESAMEQLNREGSILEANYANAMAKGDFQGAAKVQRLMAQNEAKLLQLENGKEAMASKPKAKAPAPQYSDMSDAFAAQLQGRSRQWVLEHREHANSQAKINAIIGAHNIALSRGHAADTDGYFGEVERILGINQAKPQRNDAQDGEGGDELSGAAEPVSRRASPPAAPVSRSGASPGTNSPRVVRLSAEEAEIARMTGQTPEEYWKHKQAAIKSGEMTRH